MYFVRYRRLKHALHPLERELEAKALRSLSIIWYLELWSLRAKFLIPSYFVSIFRVVYIIFTCLECITPIESALVEFKRFKIHCLGVLVCVANCF